MRLPLHSNVKYRKNINDDLVTYTLLYIISTSNVTTHSVISSTTIILVRVAILDD